MFSNFHVPLKPNMVFSTKSCLFLAISVLLIVPLQTQGANILVILPSILKSHFNVFESLIKVLATEHNISFYSVRSLSETHENITEFKFSQSYSSNNMKSTFKGIAGNDARKLIFRLLHQFSDEHFNLIYHQSSFQRLLNSSDNYQMLITSNCFSEGFFKLSHVLHVPLVQVSLTISFPWTNTAIGIDNNLSNDVLFGNTDMSMNFSNRIARFIKNMHLWLYYEWFYLPKVDDATRKHFPPDTPSLKELRANTRAVLSNTVSSMGYARAHTPNVYEIGGLHCRPSKPLPSELESFVSGSREHGVIYFSLGGSVPDTILSPKEKRSILNVFRKLPQRVLWKLNEDIEDVPDNVKISNWFPQQDILGHNQTKLFIMQGGILSLQEAVYHGVPVLTIPFIADQHVNSIIANYKGYGRILHINEFTVELFEKNIRELLSKQEYTYKVKQISSAMNDHCDGNADRLKKFIKYLMQHEDESHLRPLLKPPSQIERMQLDIYAFIFCLLVIITYLLKYTFRKLFQAIKCTLRIKAKIQ